MLGGLETDGVGKGLATQAVVPESPECSLPVSKGLGGRLRPGLRALCPGPETSERWRRRLAVHGPREFIRRPYNT